MDDFEQPWYGKGPASLSYQVNFYFYEARPEKMDKMDDLGGECLKFAQKWMKSMKMDWHGYNEWKLKKMDDNGLKWIELMPMDESGWNW